MTLRFGRDALRHAIVMGLGFYLLAAVLMTARGVPAAA
jgi:uncharacterized membrane protein